KSIALATRQVDRSHSALSEHIAYIVTSDITGGSLALLARSLQHRLYKTGRIGRGPRLSFPDPLSHIRTHLASLYLYSKDCIADADRISILEIYLGRSPVRS